MARDEYERDLCSRWRTASPEPVIDTGEVLDAEFDVNDDADLRELSYQLYDEEISNRWKK